MEVTDWKAFSEKRSFVLAKTNISNEVWVIMEDNAFTKMLQFCPADDTQD